MVKFIGQPLLGTTGQLLKDALGEKEFDRATFATAFTKRAALDRLSDAIGQFRGRGGHLTLITGIDHGGTTREGLKLAFDLADMVMLTHHMSQSVTYHPKMFIFRGPVASRLIVSSSNLTAGGLWSNFEASVVLDSQQGDSLTAIEEAEGFLGEISSSALSVTLDAQVLESLLPTLPQEVFEKSVTTSNKASLAAQLGIGESPFDHSLPVVKPPQSQPTAGPSSSSSPTVTSPSTAAQTTAPPTPASPATVPSGNLSGFWKAMSEFDVSTTSGPGQIIIPARFATLFPPTSNAQMTPSGAEQSEAEVPFFFSSGSFTREGKGRLIYYKPAPTHLRPNAEYRFTFLNRDINPGGVLNEDDILVFSRTLAGSPYWFSINHAPAGTPGHAALFGTGKRFSAK